MLDVWVNCKEIGREERRRGPGGLRYHNDTLWSCYQYCAMHRVLILNDGLVHSFQKY